MPEQSEFYLRRQGSDILAEKHWFVADERVDILQDARHDDGMAGRAVRWVSPLLDVQWRQNRMHRVLQFRIAVAHQRADAEQAIGVIAKRIKFAIETRRQVERR